MKNRTGFTLIELLIVIAVLAVLATVVVLVINPAQLLAQSRDSRRLSDFQTLNKALQLAELNGVSLGPPNPNIVYVSLPSTTAPACDSSLGLPPLPSGWSYQCSNSANYRKVDSTGWMPVNFASITIGSPLSVLPVDPVNEVSTGNYYIYVTGSSYKLTALMESEKYANKMAKDGGSDVGLYEIGTNLNLANFQRGLVGYWKFEETSSTLYDSSGYVNNGDPYGGVTYGVTGKVGNALSFDGVNDYVSIQYNISHDVGGNNFTLFAWIKLIGSSARRQIIGNIHGGGEEGYMFGTNDTGVLAFAYGIQFTFLNSNKAIEQNVWYHVAFVRQGNTGAFYVNSEYSGNGTLPINVNRIDRPLYIGAVREDSNFWYGLIDDIMIYNRALSAAEISAIYNATK